MQQRRLFYFAKTKQWPRLPKPQSKPTLKHIKKKEVSLAKAREHSMCIKRVFLQLFAHKHNYIIKITLTVMSNKLHHISYFQLSEISGAALWGLRGY
jgi:hypothetical protein